MNELDKLVAYVVAQNPNEAKEFCIKNGAIVKTDNKKEIETICKKILGEKDSELVWLEFFDLHPDKDIIKSMPTVIKKCGCSACMGKNSELLHNLKQSFMIALMSFFILCAFLGIAKLFSKTE